MNSYDIDIEIQKIINKLYSELPIIKWDNWLEINSKEEYIEYVLKHTGLYSVESLFTKIKMDKTESKRLSINKDTVLDQEPQSKPLIFCHTSGTTDSRTSALKWYRMSLSNIKKHWAPGMKAIFESSGLNKKNSAVIFVPSRLNSDGLNEANGKHRLENTKEERQRSIKAIPSHSKNAKRDAETYQRSTIEQSRLMKRDFFPLFNI